MKLVVPVLEKAVASKDYGRLVPVQKVRSDGRKMTYWTLPEDANQGKIFDEETGGAESETGHRGWADAVDEGTEAYKIKPTLKEIARIFPDLAPKFEYKYENYPFDGDTKELDVKADMLFAWYHKKREQYPKEAKEWMAEYREKSDKLVVQINNRKRTMLRLKVGAPVKLRNEEGKISGFTERGFPIVKTQHGTYNSFWEEVAQSVIDNWS